MRVLKILTVVVGLALLSGCWVLSIEPLYTNDDLIFDPSLIGVWGDSTGMSEDNWTFEREDSISYRLIVREKDKPEGTLEAHLVHLSGILFLDLYPEFSESNNEFHASHTIPAHSFWRVSITGDTLSLHYLDADWMERKIEAGEITIANIRPDDAVVLAAPTGELQQLVYQHADEAFNNEPLRLYRHRRVVR